MGDNKTIRMTLLPVARIRTIMKSSPEIANINQESLFLITKATVSFQQGCRIWRAGRQNITIPGGIIILSVCLFVCFQGFSLRNSAKAIAITPSWPGITGQFQQILRLFGNIIMVFLFWTVQYLLLDFRVSWLRRGSNPQPSALPRSWVRCSSHCATRTRLSDII